MKLVVSVGLWSQAQTSTKFSNFISSDSSANQKTKWLAAVDDFNQIYVWKFELTDKAEAIVALDKILRLKDLSDEIISLKGLNKDRIFSTSASGLCHVWNLEKGIVENSILLPGRILGAVNLENGLIAIYGELSEIYIIVADTCEQYCTLLSRLYPDWVTCATSHVVGGESESTILVGVTAGGTLKLWRISNSTVRDSVTWEEESKQIRECSHPIKIVLGTKYLAILTRKSVIIIDSSDFMTLGIHQNEHNNIFTDLYFSTADTLLVTDDVGGMVTLSLTNLARNSTENEPEIQSSRNFNFKPLIASIDQTIYVLSNQQTISRLSNSLQLHDVKHSSFKNRELDILCQATSSIYPTAVCLIMKQNLIVIGRSDGSILIQDALQSLQQSTLQRSTIDQSNSVYSTQHFEKINAIYHPATYSPERFDADLIWLASHDFSVSVWSLSLRCALISFFNHSAPVQRFGICPLSSGRGYGTVYSVDSDGGFCLFSARDQLCLLSDPGNGCHVTGIQWTLDGFLYLLRNSTLNVFDAYAMTPERQLNGSEASEIFQAASINCHEVPQSGGHHVGISNRSIISLNTINAKVSKFQNSENQTDIEVIKCLEVYFDIELLIQVMIQNYRISFNQAQRAINNNSHATTNQPSQNSKLVDNLQQGISTGFQIFKNVESKIRQKSSKSGHNTPGNMTPSQVSPTHEPMATDDVAKSRVSHGTPTSPTKSMGSNKSSGNIESYSHGLTLDICNYVMSCLHSWTLEGALDQSLEKSEILFKPSNPLLYGYERKQCYSLALGSNSESSVSQRWKINEEMSLNHLLSITSLSNTIVSFPELDSEKRQIWSHLMTLHCVMLPDYVTDLIPPRIETLARHWSDKLLEVREAAQSLLLDLLRRIEQQGREEMMNYWYNVMDKELRIEDENTFSNPRVNTSVVILGVLGAEFDCLGFRTRIISERLTNLLASKENTIAKRTAVELVGRGFSNWEPHIDCASVLMALLEHTIDYQILEDQFRDKIILSSQAELCRAAHKALCQIAKSRASTFIITIAREVARHTAAVVNPATAQKLQASTLVRAKDEVLRIIELLAEKMPNAISDLLGEVVDIVLFCVDSTALKRQRLSEAFPPFQKFQMLSFCNQTRKISAGTKSGQVIIYDLRTLKSQVVQAHQGAVSALCFSPAGKYLASYSQAENRLSFWIMVSSIFGMVTSHVKCVKSVGTVPLQGHQSESPKLVWVNKEVAVLLNSDGSEYRFHV